MADEKTTFDINKQEGTTIINVDKLEGGLHTKGAPESSSPTKPKFYESNMTPPEPAFTGRIDMLDKLSGWYRDPGVKVGAIVGWGGVGKSSLTRKWFDTRDENEILPDGTFWWGFYGNMDIELFLSALIAFMGGDEVDLTTLKGTWTKVDWVKCHINEREYLIILDGLEVLQNHDTGEDLGKLKNSREVSEILCHIADYMEKGLCLISTRLPIKDLSGWSGGSFAELPIHDLGKKDALAMLKGRGVKGEDTDIDALVEKYKGHALSLTTVAGYLVKYFDGDVKEAPDIKIVLDKKKRFKNVDKLLKKYSKMLTDEGRAFMSIFALLRTNPTQREFDGLFRKPMDDTDINSDLVKMDEEDFIDLREVLKELRLITEGDDEAGKYWSIHPITKEYFDSTLDKDTRAACHRAIYYFIDTNAPELPNTIEEMAPLFEQIYHGCRGGLHDEAAVDVFNRKITRKETGYLTHMLGAWETELSIIRNFFPNGDFNEIPIVTIRAAQLYFINEAALDLLYIGRPYEADRLFVKVIELYEKDKNPAFASASYTNLTELRLKTGNIKGARKSAKKALNASVNGEDQRIQITSKAWLAYCGYLTSNTEGALTLFNEATILQNNLFPQSGELYSLRGILFTETLIRAGDTERAIKVTTRNLKICKNNNASNDISRCLRVLGTIKIITANYLEAWGDLEKALAIGRSVGQPSLEIETLIERAHLGVAIYGNDDIKLDLDPISDIETVLKLCERTGFRLYSPEAKVVLAEYFEKTGDHDNARKFAEEAKEEASAMGFHWPVHDADELLKRL